LPNIPDINYAACATLLSSDFTQIIHDLRLSFNDSIHITLSKEGAQFFTKNKSLLLEQNDIACQLFKKHMDQNSRGKKKAKKYNPAKGQLGNIGVDIKMPQNCQYTMSLSINYFVGMISKCPLSDTVQLMFENDLPFLVCNFCIH
jgi:Proliferating cell nuclear antigen, C-terminal domain